MLLTLLSSLILALIFFFVGAGVTYLSIKNSSYLLPVSILVGLASTLYLCWSISYGNLLIFVGTGIIFLIFLICTLISFARKNFWGSVKSQMKKFTLYVTPGFLLMYIPQNVDFFRQGLKLRTGPDLMGWLLASQYFENNINTGELNLSLKRQLGNQENYFTESASGSVYSLASYNEQVQAEFILGSRRLGLPSLVGYASRFFGFLDSQTILISIIAIAGGLTSVFILNYSLFKHNHFSLPLLAILFTIGSTSVLAPIYEGGVWHAIFIPIFIISLVFLLDSSQTEGGRAIALGLIFSSSISITSDILIASIPLFVAYAFWYFSAGKVRDFFISGSGALLLIPGIQELGRAFISRGNDAAVGGWQATYLGLPGDFLGLTLWQNSFGLVAPGTQPTLVQWVAGLLATVLGLIVFLKSHKDTRSVLVPYFLTLTLMFLYFYWTVLTNGTSNNYIIWKLSFLWVLPFAFVLISYYKVPSISKVENNKNKVRVKKEITPGSNNFKYTGANFLTSWTLLLLIVFQSGWAQNSKEVPFREPLAKSSSQAKQLSNLMQKYDLVSYCARWGHSISIYGDLHLTSQRRKGTLVKARQPVRSKMILLDSLEPACSNYLAKHANPGLLFRIQNLEFYEVGVTFKSLPG